MGSSSREFHRQEYRQGQSHPEYEWRALSQLVVTRSGGNMAVGQERLGEYPAEKCKSKPVFRE